MNLKKFLEFKESDLEPVVSFKIKDNLNKIWDNKDLDKEVREDLLTIGKDFYESTEIKADVIDIVLCGSLCNYNWSEKYSDYDLHIIINYKDVNEDIELVEKLCDLSKKQWNQQHEIEVKGYPVEVAIQDEKDLRKGIKSGRMGGAFSLLNNKWIKVPEKHDFKPDESLISEKGKTIMMEVDDISDNLENLEYDEIKNRVKKVWEKIKKLRERALEEEGEFGIGNLVFKLLRRNNYVGKVMDLKRKSYDKQFENKSFSFYNFDKLGKKNLDRIFGFDRDDVDDSLIDFFDEFSDKMEASVNFKINTGTSLTFANDKDINDYNIKEIICQINFYLNSPDLINSKENTKDNIANTAFKLFNSSFFTSMGFNIKTSIPKKIEIVTSIHPYSGVKYGPMIGTIIISKNVDIKSKTSRPILEYTDKAIFDFLYGLELIIEHTNNSTDEDFSEDLSYSYDEDLYTIKIEMGGHGYSDGWSEDWTVDFSDPEFINVKRHYENTGPYGDGSSDTIEKYDTLGEVLVQIKNLFGL